MWGAKPTKGECGGRSLPRGSVGGEAYQGGVWGAKPPPKKGGLGGGAPSLGLINVSDNFSYVCYCICCRPSINYQTIKSPFF